MRNHTDIRGELEERLGCDLRQEAWEFLEDNGYIRDVRQGETSIPELAEQVREYFRAFGRQVPFKSHAPLMRSPASKQQTVKARYARLEALSDLLAQDAAQDVLAQAFRRDVLADNLLGREDVETWIKRHAELEGEPTKWLQKVPLPPGTRLNQCPTSPLFFPDPPLVLDKDHPLRSVRTELLEYGVPEDEWARYQPITAGGVLEQLKGVSEHLANHYGWQEGQAVLFVLTGIPPLVSAIRAGAHIRSLLVASRITLEIDPALSPREVADAYRRVRQQMVGGRHRELSEKHTRLALFAATRTANETWRERMEEWNKQHPKWRYTRETNFARDCDKAQQRLLNPAYRIPLVEGSNGET